MGTPADFHGATHRFYAKPNEDGTDRGIATIDCYNNGRYTMSKWELTDEEIEEIVRTRRVTSVVLGGPDFFPMFVGSDKTSRRAVLDYGPPWPKEPQVTQA